MSARAWDRRRARQRAEATVRATERRGLFEEVVHRLADEALLSRGDLQESMDQMRRGETRVLVPKPADPDV